MADAVTTFIEAVHTELAKPELHGATMLHCIGAKHWKEHKQPPFIKWRRADITHAAVKGKNADSPTIYTRNQTLILSVWMADEEACELMLDNVIRAARIAAGGSDNLRPGRFVWVTEETPGAGWESLGAALLGDMTVDLQIAESPHATVRVTIESQQHTITLGSTL